MPRFIPIGTECIDETVYSEGAIWFTYLDGQRIIINRKQACVMIDQGAKVVRIIP